MRVRAAAAIERPYDCCGFLGFSGAHTPSKYSSLSASARNFFSRRKCSSRDSGDRHIPAQRWCCRAIARYSIALAMTVLPRKYYSSGRDQNEPRGTLKRVPIKVRWKIERFALAFRLGCTIILHSVQVLIQIKDQAVSASINAYVGSDPDAIWHAPSCPAARARTIQPIPGELAAARFFAAGAASAHHR